MSYILRIRVEYADASIITTVSCLKTIGNHFALKLTAWCVDSWQLKTYPNAFSAAVPSGLVKG